MSRPTAHLVHGFNVADKGAGTVGKLAPYFAEAGFDVRVHGYPWTFLLTLRARNKAVAKDLARHIKPGDVLVGHSNGCAIIDLCLREYRAFGDYGLIYINPALPREHPVPKWAAWLRVYSAESDKPVKWASRLRRFSPISWVCPHPWGAMGRHGYLGDDPRATNVYMDSAIAKLGHSGVFEEPWLTYFGADMADHAAQGAAA